MTQLEAVLRDAVRTYGMTAVVQQLADISRDMSHDASLPEFQRRASRIRAGELEAAL
jgi:hypothetical protein